MMALRIAGAPFSVALLVMSASAACAPALGQKVVDLPPDDHPLELQSQELYTVGSLLGEEWETFSRIAGVAFDEEGNLYILDADNFRVVKVGPEGELVAEMGGEGGGPGEFGMPFGMAVTRAGEVAVFDFAHRGFTVFDSDASFRTTVPLDPDLGAFPGQELLSHPDGGVISAGGSVQIRPGPDGGPQIPNTRLVRFYSLSEGGGVETVYEGWNPATAAGGGSLQTTGGGAMRFSAPPVRAFDPELLVGVLPDGRLAVADSFAYEVKVGEVGAGAETVYRRGLSPRKVTRRDREREKARRLEEMEASGGHTIVMRTSEGASSRLASEQAKALVQGRLESMDFAEEIPVISGMAVDWAGRIWIERTGREIGERGPVDVLDPVGVYLGTLQAQEFEIPGAFGPSGLAAFLERDEMDVPRIVVKRVSLTSPPPSRSIGGFLRL